MTTSDVSTRPIAAKLYVKPTSLFEAHDLASKYLDSFSFLAGGTDLLVNKFQGNNNASCLIDLSDIKSLKEVIVDENVLKIGSMVKLDDLHKHALIVKQFPALIQAAAAVASPILRKSATIGGNILCENRCTFYNQSEWWRTAIGYCLKCEGTACIATGGTKACFSKSVSDTVPVLISMDALLEIAEPGSVHLLPLQSLYTGNGINPRDLAKNAIIQNIVLPLNRNFKTAFRKLRPRAAVDFSSLTSAVTIDSNRSLKIVLGGVDPAPIMVQGHANEKEILIKRAVKLPRIVDNDYYPRAYRKEMISVFLEESFTELGL